MKQIIKYYLILILASLGFAGCSSLLDPVDDNHDTFDRVNYDPAYAEGLLMNVYSKLPSNSFSFNDVATDDAVSNNKFDGYLRIDRKSVV